MIGTAIRAPAEPQVELYQRVEAQSLKQPFVARLGRAVPGDAVVEAARATASGATAAVAMNPSSTTGSR